jgi:hypothetical protein
MLCANSVEEVCNRWYDYSEAMERRGVSPARRIEHLNSEHKKEYLRLCFILHGDKNKGHPHMDVLQLALKREIQVWGELTRVEAIKGEREREEARLAADELRKKAAFEETKRKDAAEKKAFQAEIPAAPQSEWKCDCGACNVEAASVCAMCEAVPGAWEDSDQPPKPQWHEAGDDAWEAVFGSLWTEMTDFFDFDYVGDMRQQNG